MTKWSDAVDAERESLAELAAVRDELGRALSALSRDMRRFGDAIEDASRDLDPGPDFGAMDDDEVRAWLDERGRRWSQRGVRSWLAGLYIDESHLNTRGHNTEVDALRALALKVWEREQT